MAIHQALASAIIAGAVGLGTLSQAKMPDQHGRADSLAAHRGQPVVVVVVDARRLGTVRRWARDLMTRYPSLQLLTVADVNEKQPTTVEQVATVLARHVPPEASVLIDMQRLWAREFDLDTTAPNLVIFDRDGAVVARFRGRWSERLATDVAAAVAALGVTA